MKSLISTISAVLQNSPDRVFIKYVGSSRGYQLSQLKADIGLCTLRLKQNGLHPAKHVVGIAMRSSYEWIIADLTVMLHEGVTLPVPLDFTDEQIDALLSHVDYCIIQDRFVADRLHKLMPHKTLVSITGEVFHASPKPINSSVNNPMLHGKDIIKIIHTSGTTSKPKGVMIRDAGIGLLIKNLLNGCVPTGPLHYLSLVPMSLLIEQVLGIYLPLLSGGTLSFIPATLGEFGSSRVEINEYLHCIKHSSANFMFLPPVILEEMCRQLSVKPESLFFNSIASPHIITGGAKVNKTVLETLLVHGIDIYEGYGLSENSSVASLNTPLHRKIGSAGRLLPNIEASIINGELCIKSETVCAGYFTTDSSSCDIDKDGYLKTGDIAHVDEEGYLYITGRKKNLIILSNARNVSPEWVEQLFKTNNVINDVVILGDGMDTLSAVIITDKTIAKCALWSVIQMMNEKLPDFAHVTKVCVIDDTARFKDKYFTLTGRPKRAELHRDFHHFNFQDNNTLI